MKKDKIRNEQVRGSVKVEPVQISAEKKDEMVWMDGWRGEGDSVRRMSDAQLPGKRQKQRQKPRHVERLMKYRDDTIETWTVWGLKVEDLMN